MAVELRVAIVGACEVLGYEVCGGDHSQCEAEDVYAVQGVLEEMRKDAGGVCRLVPE